jgi:hypothetical protein
MPGRATSLLRRWGMLGYTALVFTAGGVVPAANAAAPDPTPRGGVPTPDPRPIGPPRAVQSAPPVVRRSAPVVQAPRYVPPAATAAQTPSRRVSKPAARAARHAPAARRATRARTAAKPKPVEVVRSVPRDAPLVVAGAAAAHLVLDEPDRAATTFAVLALLVVVVASGSFLGLLVEVRRNLS